MKDSILKLKELRNCNSCGGLVNTGVCLSCDKVYEEEKLLEEKIINWLNSSEEKKFSDIIYLYQIKESDFINEYINSNITKEDIDNNYEQIKQKIINGKHLNDKEENSLSGLLHVLPTDKKVYITEYIFSMFIHDICVVSESTLKDVFYHLIKNIDNTLEIKFCELDENVKARYMHPKHIEIALNTIKEFHTGISKNLIDSNKQEVRLNIVETIYHEYIHHLQYLREKNSNTLIGYIESKESIIRIKYPEYYKQNYMNITYEKEAHRISKFIKECYSTILCTEEEKNKIINNIIFDIIKEENFIRNLNNENVDLNILFDQIILNNPIFLESHPVFNLEYTKDENNNIRHLTKSEIVDKLLENNIDSLFSEYIINNHSKLENNDLNRK